MNEELFGTHHAGKREDELSEIAGIAIATGWLCERDKLVKIRKVTRSVEMTLDIHDIGLERSLQFVTDCEKYNLYEAALMMGNADGKRWKVMDTILTDMRLASLPKTRISQIKPKATKIESVVKTLRPESIWTLQKHLIEPLAMDSRVEKIFDSVLPFSAPEGMPRPYTSQDYIKVATDTSIWNAVHWAPIKYREALCQRLIALFAIPEPEPVKNGKHHVVTSGAKQKSRDKVLVVDKGGSAWTWNCGWRRVGESGDFLDPMHKAMGHASFKRCIIPAGPEDYARTSFRYTRPWGQWRKGSGPVAHDQFGNGTLLLTDGLHAVVLFENGMKQEVILENLHNIGEKTVRKYKADEAKAPKTPKAKKTNQPFVWDDML